MKCEGVQDILSEYIDGEIAEPVLKEAVEEHLRACASCRAMAAELRDVQKAVHSLLTVTAPKDMIAQVAKGVEGIAAASGIPVQEIRRAESQLQAGRNWRRFAWPAMMAAAAMLLGVFVLIQVSTILREDKRSLLEERARLAEAPLGGRPSVSNVAPASKPSEPGLELEKEVAEAPMKDRLSVSNALPTDKAPMAGHGGEARGAFAGPEKAATRMAKAAPTTAFLSDEGRAMKAAQPSAAAPPPTQQAPQTQVAAAPGRSEVQAQTQAVPKEQRQLEEPAQLAERMPAQVADQFQRSNKKAGVVAKGGQPPNPPAPSAGPEVKAGAEYTAQGKGAPPGKEVESEAPKVAEEMKPEGRGEARDSISTPAGTRAAQEAPETAEESRPLTGKAESKTLTLRVQDIPAATAEVKEILVRNGAQLSKDYYAGGGLEGAGARLNARLPASRYPSVLNELRDKNYLAPERTKVAAKAHKAKASAPPDVIDLAIRFQANAAAAEAAKTAK